MKPMLATNWDESKLKFPIGVQAKIDGVRALNLDGNLTGRSLKKFKNKFLTERFSKDIYLGFDGEMATGSETDPKLCRLTSSALSTITGEPYVLWHVFDFVRYDVVHLPYHERYDCLVQFQNHFKLPQIRVVPMKIAHDMQELLAYDASFLGLGYEGTILRDLNGMHKQGRSTVREQGLLRIKRFEQEEAIVLSINEGRTNNNETQTNELGRTYRTSHQDNQTPNGMVGSMECAILKDSELFKKGQIITVSKGEMTADESSYHFANPTTLIGKVISFKHFPKGVKDQPRFPTFSHIRSEEDQ